MQTLTFRQPRLVALILLVLISAGLSSFLSLGRQEDPTITNVGNAVQFAPSEIADSHFTLCSELHRWARALHVDNAANCVAPK